MKVLFPCRWMEVWSCRFFPCAYNLLYGGCFDSCLFPCLGVYDMGWPSTPFRILVAWSITCSLFDILEGFSFSARGSFFWCPPFCCSNSTTLCNIYTTSSVLLSSLWNLVFFLLSPYRTLLLSLVMPLSITVQYTHKFRRLAISSNTATKLVDNELG